MKWLKKGMKIAVCGRIQTGSYTGKDNRKIYTTNIVVDEHYFADVRANNSESKPDKGTEDKIESDKYMEPSENIELAFE